MKYVWIAAIALQVMVGVALAQDAKSETKPVDIITAGPEVKLKEADAAKIVNLQLVLQNLELQMQNAKLQMELIKKEVPAIIDQLFAAYKLSKDEWAFDEAKMQFVRKVKERQ